MLRMFVFTVVPGICMPMLAMSCAAAPTGEQPFDFTAPAIRFTAGFVVRDCWMHDTFQRVLINGAPGGLIENNTFENLGHGLDIQFETWGPSGNSYRRRFAAMPVTNMTITGNSFTQASAPMLKIHNVKGLTIRDNTFDLPADAPRPVRQGQMPEAPWLVVQDCEDVTASGNTTVPAGRTTDDRRGEPPADSKRRGEGRDASGGVTIRPEILEVGTVLRHHERRMKS